jgi:zinc protease
MIVGFIAWGGLKMPKDSHFSSDINVEDILNNSVLKDKKFAADVQVVQYEKMTAYMMEEHSNPLISISFSFRYAGAAHDAENKHGLSGITAAMLLAGAGKYSEQELAELCDEYGIKIVFSTSQDDIYGYMAMPTENKKIALDLLKQILTAPRLDEDYLRLVKQQTLTSLNIQKERPEGMLADKFREVIFAEHPYANNQLGKKEDIINITTDDIRDFIQNKLGQSNLLVGIAGDVTRTDVQEILAEVFGSLPEDAEVSRLPDFDYTPSGKVYNVEGETFPQAITRFITCGTQRNSPDFYALYLANRVLGDVGLSSRLIKAVREDKGLTYGVYSFLSIADSKATIEGSFSATPENFAEALEIVKAEWLRMGKDGVTEDELATAKKSLITSFNLRFANMDNISDMLVSMQKHSLGIDFLDKRNDYIANVPLAEVNAAAKKYFSTVPDFVNIGVVNVEEK